ncbi:hypothetical protein [Myxosarcina sp. GI1(2024)]
MFDLEPIFEFSRHNCATICAFLVPANLLTTILTIVLLVEEKSLLLMRLSVVIASVWAMTLFLHISTWFAIGVVTPVTFILFGLGSTCLLVNFLLLKYRHSLRLFLIRWTGEQLALEHD